MKNFTKKLALLLVFAMVLGVVSPTIVAKADGVSKIVLNFQELKLTVTYNGSNGYADYDFTQFVPKTGTTAPTENDLKAIKDKDWATVDSEFTSNAGDISWFNKKKASYAVARVWNTTKKDYDYVVSDLIQPQEDALKVLYSDKNEAAATNKTPAYTSAQAIGSEATGYFVFYKGKNAETFKVISPSAVSFHKDGSYYTQHAKNGTLTVTYPFIEAIKDGMSKGVTLMVFQAKTAGSDDVTGWPVKETKYKFAAQKAAPTVKLDITHVVPLKSGQEYRIVDASTTSKKYSAWVKVDDAHGETDSKGKVKIGKILLEDLVVTTGGIKVESNKIDADFATDDGKLNPTKLAAGSVKLQVRTAASSKGVASKIYSVVVSQAAIAEDAIGKDVTVAWTVPYDKTKGLTITNKSKDDYEYAFTISGAAVDGNTKWKTVKAEKAAAEKSLQDKDKKDYTVVHVRKVGDKKAGILSSNYADVTLALVPSTPQAISPQNGTGASVTGATTAKYTYTTAGAVTVTIPVAAVSGTAIENASVSIPVTGIVKGEIKKWDKKGTNKAFTVDVPEYKDGAITVKFDVKKDTAASTSDEYKVKVESLELTFKFKVE